MTEEQNFIMKKKAYTMNKEAQWESQGSKNACRCCGQFIKNEELYYFVIINGSDLRKAFPKESNFIIHQDEFDSLIKQEGTQYKAIELMFNKPRKRPKNATPVDEAVVEKFKQVVSQRGFRIKSETKNRITFSPSYRDKSPFVFDKRFKTIEYNGRGKNGLFDRLFVNEFISRINEDMYEVPEEEKYRALDVIGKAVDKTNEMMGK